MSVFEEIISQRLQPRSTVVLAFGFDEETGGAWGAAEIAKGAESEWGRDGFSIVLDQGGMGLATRMIRATILGYALNGAMMMLLNGIVYGIFL